MPIIYCSRSILYHVTTEGVLAQQAVSEGELCNQSYLSALTQDGSLIHWLLFLLHHSKAEGHEAASVTLPALNLCEGTRRSSGGVGVEKRLPGVWECELLLTAKKLYEAFWNIPSVKSSRHPETRSNHYYRLWGGHRLHTSFIWLGPHTVSLPFASGFICSFPQENNSPNCFFSGYKRKLLFL